VNNTPETDGNRFSRPLPEPIVLTLVQARQVTGGGGVTVTADQVYDALGQAIADTKARTKPRFMA
jgi:hypothetical protein